MQTKPLVVIASRSPPLEAVARAVLGGAAHESGADPLPIQVVGAGGELGSAPILFVGWQGDREKFLPIVRDLLASLPESPASPRHVALFEVSLDGAVRCSTDAPTDRPVPGSRTLRLVAPPESFVLDPVTLAGSQEPAELGRARRWAAQVYSEWRSTLGETRPRDFRQRETSTRPHSVPWCGAMD